ncbi:hypothetical protein [Sinorhizobium sp. BG8]|uniref:hypothetical protein n=1 Tax=Sinorhizobium sp. BG8 TaxID=2613773 RepID=UPI00193E9C82|nr:hypothetical protein [Sinorhizobium sp. BG8]QRM55129.1 hypothetical protein F3Y30_11740 [Sinorhizobium sp. BG8]
MMGPGRKQALRRFDPLDEMFIQPLSGTARAMVRAAFVSADGTVFAQTAMRERAAEQALAAGYLAEHAAEGVLRITAAGIEYMRMLARAA